MVHISIRTPNPDFAYFYWHHKWFVYGSSCFFSSIRVIFIAWGSVWELLHTVKFIGVIGRQQWVKYLFCPLICFPKRLPLPPIFHIKLSSWVLPTAYIDLSSRERQQWAWSLDRYFTWTWCLSCEGKLWFQALLWHYFLFPHWQRTVGVISLIGVIMG